jgi:hypothetical protein
MIEWLQQISKELEWLEPPPIFIGGSALALYLDPFSRSQLRTTKDVDIIVCKIKTYLDWSLLEKTLRLRGWKPNMSDDAPLCRYISPSEILVDFMSPSEEVLGFTNQWYSEIKDATQEYQIGEHSILIAQPAHFLATKLEAHLSRGKDDPWMSHDLEDIVALVDGCTELIESIKKQNNYTHTV